MRVDIYRGNTDTIDQFYTNVSQVSLDKNGALSLIRPFTNPDGSQNVIFKPSANKIVITREGTET